MIGIDLQQLEDRLLNIVKEHGEDFDEIISRINTEDKYKIEKLLAYVNKVLDNFLTMPSLNREVNSLHIEIYDLKCQYHEIIKAFLILKFFFVEIRSDNKGNEFLMSKIDELKKIQKATINLDIPGVVLGDILARNKNIEKIIAFYNEIIKINPHASHLPSVLINVGKENGRSKDLFNNLPYMVDLNDNELRIHTYVLLNDSLDHHKLLEVRDSVYGDNLSLIENLHYVINFNTLNLQSRHSGWTKAYLQGLNNYTPAPCKFKGLILVSFKNDILRFRNLENSVSRSTRYLGPIGSNSIRYTIFPEETKSLVDEEASENHPQVHIDFVGEIVNESWENFRDLVSDVPGLQKMVQTRLRKLYSMSLNEELRNYILSMIFIEPYSGVIDLDLIEELRILDQRKKGDLKESLSSVLDSIIGLNWLAKISKCLKNRNIIILPNFVIQNKCLLDLMKKTLRGNNSFNTLQELEMIERTNTVILDYRDHGRFPFTFTNNIIDTELRSGSKKAIYLRFLFEAQYILNRFEHQSAAVRLEDSIFRKELGTSLVTFLARPQVISEYDDYYDEDESDQEISTSYSIKFNDREESGYSASSFHLFQVENSRIAVLELMEIMKHLGNEQFKVQPVDSILDGYDASVTTEDNKSKGDFIELRKRYLIDSQKEAKAIWKSVLAKKCEKDEDQIFEEIEKKCSDRKIEFVSKNTFQRVWLDDRLASLPRSKKLFRFLCTDFLELGLDYYKAMRKLKNEETLSVKERNRLKTELLIDLIRDGCLEESQDYKSLIQQNKQKYFDIHDLEVIGCYEEDEIESALIEFIEHVRARIDLKVVLAITKRN